MNEAGVGEGIRSCGVAREELFITTKVAAEAKTYDAVTQSIDDSLAKMGLDYIDLLIIHSPQPWKEFREENRYFWENKEVWKAMEFGTFFLFFKPVNYFYRKSRCILSPAQFVEISETNW